MAPPPTSAGPGSPTAPTGRARTEGRPSILAHPRFLLGVSAALMAGGVLAILLGWDGAANATVVEAQVPYLVSGGLLGLALATIGGLTFFAHWLTVSIREARAREARPPPRPHRAHGGDRDR